MGKKTEDTKKKIEEIVDSLEKLVKALKVKTKNKTVSKETNDVIKEIVKEFKPKEKAPDTIFSKVKRSVSHLIYPDAKEEPVKYLYPHFSKAKKWNPNTVKKLLLDYEQDFTPTQKRDLEKIIKSVK